MQFMFPKTPSETRDVIKYTESQALPPESLFELHWVEPQEPMFKKKKSVSLMKRTLIAMLGSDFHYSHLTKARKLKH